MICGSDRCGDRLIVLKFGTLSTLRRWVSNLYVKEFEAFLRSGQHEFSLYVESPASKFLNWSAKHKGCTRLLLQTEVNLRAQVQLGCQIHRKEPTQCR